MDVIVDLGVRRLPIEIKLGETVVADFFKGLDRYGSLAGSSGGWLVNGGARTYQRGSHQVRAWWTMTRGRPRAERTDSERNP